MRAAMDPRLPRKSSFDDTRPTSPLLWDHRRKSKLPRYTSRYTPPQPSQKVNLMWLWAAVGLTALLLSSHSRSVVAVIQMGCGAIGCVFIFGFITMLLFFGIIPLIR